MTRLGFIFYSMIFLASIVMAGKPTAEEENLYNECDKGNGKYSSCTKLIKILSEKCDSGDMIGCADVGYIMGFELGMREASVAPLDKSCKAGVAESCYNLGIFDIMRRGNIERAFSSYVIACEKFNDEKKLLKLKSCSSLLKSSNFIKPVKGDCATAGIAANAAINVNNEILR